MRNQLSDDDLRAGLRTIAGWADPATPSLDALAPTLTRLEGVESTDRRRRNWWAAAAALIVVLVAVATLPGGRDSGVSGAGGSWHKMAEAPIAARANAATAWTGKEVLIIGGESPGRARRADAAAYNPRTNTWRRLPDAPHEVPGGADGVWTGTEVAVMGAGDYVSQVPNNTTADGPPPMAFNPVTNVWRVLPALPSTTAGVPTAAAAWGQTIVATLGSAAHNGAAVVRLPAGAAEWETSSDDLVPRSTNFRGRRYAVLAAKEHVVVTPTEWFGLLPGDMLGRVIRAGNARVPSESVTHPGPSWIPASVDLFQSRQTLDGEGRLLVVGLATDGEGTTQRVTLRYDVRTRRWTRIEDPKHHPVGDYFESTGLVAMRGGVALIGGADDRGVRFGNLDGSRTGARRFLPNGSNSWVDLPKPPIDLARAGPVVVWTGRQLVVWGGLKESGGSVNGADAAAPGGAVLTPR